MTSSDEIIHVSLSQRKVKIPKLLDGSVHLTKAFILSQEEAASPRALLLATLRGERPFLTINYGYVKDKRPSERSNLSDRASR